MICAGAESTRARARASTEVIASSGRASSMSSVASMILPSGWLGIVVSTSCTSASASLSRPSSHADIACSRISSERQPISLSALARMVTASSDCPLTLNAVAKPRQACTHPGSRRSASPKASRAVSKLQWLVPSRIPANTGSSRCPSATSPRTTWTSGQRGKLTRSRDSAYCADLYRPSNTRLVHARPLQPRPGSP